jgi:hypothetical protein
LSVFNGLKKIHATIVEGGAIPLRSSARATKRFPSPHCASTTKMVRPLESIAETQPHEKPALLRLSAIVSQYFIGSPHRKLQANGQRRFLLDGKPFSLLYGCRMKPKSETQILWQDQAREVLLHGGTVDSFVRPYHPDLRFAAFRAYIGAVRNALFHPRTARRQSKRSP